MFKRFTSRDLLLRIVMSFVAAALMFCLGLRYLEHPKGWLWFLAAGAMLIAGVLHLLAMIVRSRAAKP